MTYTFEIISPKHGPFVVTVPVRFRPEIEKHIWGVAFDPHRAKGREFYVKTSDRTPDGRRKNLYLHVLIWKLLGNAPVREIDHKDGQPLNNAEDNLRDGSKGNSRNRQIQRNNTSGMKGVTWSKRHEKWLAQIIVDSKNRLLGVFSEKADAARAYNAAALKYHKEFAVLNEIPGPEPGAC